LTKLEKMQYLALTLDGPATECLREVREDEPGVYDKLKLTKTVSKILSASQ